MIQTIHPGTRLRPSERAVMRGLDDEAVVLDLRSGQYFSLNATGRRVWELVAAGCDVAAVVDALAGEFDAPRSALADDVGALLAELVEVGLLVRA
jgi:hypothetical protein